MFTPSDIKLLHQLCRNTELLPSPPKCLDLVSGDGVILESTAESQIRNIICEDHDEDGAFGRITIFEVAGRVRLEVAAVEKLLPTDEEEWGRVGTSVIIRTPEFRRLCRELKHQISNGVINVPEFCKSNQIDADFFRTILPPRDGSWKWLGDMVHIHGVQYADEIEKKLLKELESVDSPKSLTDLLPQMSLPLQFVSNIVANLISEGKLDGTLESGKFVPVSYVERRREALVQQLRAEGLIALEDFKRERIEDPEDFVHRQLPDAILLAQHFVTPSFIAHIEGLVLESIEKQEWSDVKDPDQRLSSMDENKLRILISHSLPELQLIADRLVSNDLEGRLRSRTKQFAQKRADGAWRNRSTTPTDTTKITWAELSKHIHPDKPLPPALLSHFMTTLHPYSHTVFSTRLDELRQDESRAAKVSFSDKFVLRFVVYSQGARSLADKSLRSKLESDLCQFATETGIPVLDKLETVLEDDPTANIEQLQHLQALLKGVGESKDVQKRLHDIERGIRDALQSVDMEYPDDAALSTKKAFLVREMSSKLQATSDLSLQVLLVLLLGHAKHKPGVLKASGKYVPKLLKELHATGVFDEAQMAALNKAKAAVTGKEQITDAELENLKTIGARLAGY